MAETMSSHQNTSIATGGGALAAEPVITLKGVGKKYNLDGPRKARWRLFSKSDERVGNTEFWALRDVDLTVRRGESLGMLGLNGAGKSTLLGIIAGLISPSEGQVSVNGRVQLLQLGVGFVTGKTGRENVRDDARAHGHDAATVERIVESVESFADIGPFFDQPVSTYSSGMHGRVAFGNAFAIDPDVLIVDEALAVGDAVFVNKCFRRLREAMDRGTTLLFTSHSTDAIVRMCSEGLVLNRGVIVKRGTAKEAADAYTEIVHGTSAREGKARIETGSTETAVDNATAISLDGFGDAQNRTGVNGQLSPGSQLATFSFSATDAVDRCHRSPFFNPQSTINGDGRAAIVDLEVFVNGVRKSDNRIPHGARVDIFYRVYYKAEFSRPVTGFIVDDESGLTYYGTNQLFLDIPTSPVRAGETRTFQLGFTALLAERDWFVSLAAAEELTVAQQRVSLVHFRIVTKLPAQIGVGWLDYALSPRDGPDADASQRHNPTLPGTANQ